MSLLRPNPSMITADEALPGRQDYAYDVPETHFVHGMRIREPFEREDLQSAVFAMGCFWGAEKDFWQLPGVWSTAAGYAGGFTPFPTYQETCTGRTGHAEAVRVIFVPDEVGYTDLVKHFFENHDPTQGLRQGNDVGSQYRSAIYYDSELQRAEAELVAREFEPRLAEAGYGAVTTEIARLKTFYYAEEYHQQYLAKNPYGYCPVHATGVTCG